VINRAEKSLDQVLLDDDHDVFVDTLRADLTEMLCALAHHRQRGADLIYSAYAVDIGGGVVTSYAGKALAGGGMNVLGHAKSPDCAVTS